MPTDTIWQATECCGKSLSQKKTIFGANKIGWKGILLISMGNQKATEKSFQTAQISTVVESAKSKQISEAQKIEISFCASEVTTLWCYTMTFD